MAAVSPSSDIALFINGYQLKILLYHFTHLSVQDLLDYQIKDESAATDLEGIFLYAKNRGTAQSLIL